MSSQFPCPCCRYETVKYPGGFEQCPVCGWTDAGAYNDAGSVWLDQAQRNFREFGACCRRWLKCVTPPPAALRRAPPPWTIDEWKHALAAQFIDRARQVFGSAPRPRHFTKLRCDESIEHDQTMRAFDNDTLPIAPLQNPGWDPLGVLTPEAFRYFMPGLIRVQIEALQPDAADVYGWRNLYLLDFHLRDAQDKRFSLFAAEQIQLVAELYQAVLQCPGFVEFFDGVRGIQGAAQAWLTRAARPHPG